MMRLVKLCFGLLILASCAPEVQDKVTQKGMGDFRLGYAVVVGEELVQGPLSRQGDPDLIIASVKSAIEKQLSDYKGSKYYHVAVKLEAYILAQPGVPLVFSPKSTLILQVGLWDNVTQQRMAEPEQIRVVEPIRIRSLIGSGYTQNAEEQTNVLAKEGARMIEEWLKNKHEMAGWFSSRGDQAEQP